MKKNRLERLQNQYRDKDWKKQMSRSRRKTKIFGHGSGSDKTDKRRANRRLRRVVKCGRLDVKLRDISDPWGWSKDGKRYFNNATEKDMRK